VKFLGLIFKNVRRNAIRSTLTAVGTMVLVFVVTLVWSILNFLDAVTAEKTDNLKAIVTERWQIPSQMPFSYADSLSDGAARNSSDVHPLDAMTWQFYGGTVDPAKKTIENMLFAFAMAPDKVGSMLDDLELNSLPPAKADSLRESIARLKDKRQGIIVGREKLAQIHKQMGDRFKLTSINYKDIDLEFEVVGVFPDGRYDKSAVMNRDYLNAALDAYPRSHAGQKHPLADKTLNLVWLRVPDMLAFNTVQEQITKAPFYTSPAVKCETSSSGIATFLEAYRDLIWGMRWLLAPAILLTLSLVIANAISISVRERRLEFAVLRVLGFRPRQVLALVVGEAVLLGAGAGLLSTLATYTLINKVMGGINFPIAFFGAFFIPTAAIWWGLAIGVFTALAGSVVPAISASSIRVTEAFSKVA
jgi:putative ABC transport system permease protein